MPATLSQESLDQYSDSIRHLAVSIDEHYPGESGSRQPVHSVYGGAQLFNADTISKLGGIALAAFQKYAGNCDEFGGLLAIPERFREEVFGRVAEKLKYEAIEDYRIDFEDGYGPRSDVEEDGHAVSTAGETAQALADGRLSPFFGIRVKPLTEQAGRRSIRTLDLFLTSLCSATGGRLPDNFVVTLPKVVSPEQVSILASALDELETKLGIERSFIKIEVMVETAQSVVWPDGNCPLPAIVKAGRGRCRGAHFGAYDHTASLGITSAYQDMLHPACDFARNMMQAALSGTGVWLADGATNIMPVGPHRGNDLTAEQRSENVAVVHRAWRLHYDHCRHSLANGFYQGWDLHPAQFPTRYAALYSFFLEGLEPATERLRNFLDAAARATLIGDVFDDAATGQGLLNYFLRAINCGAMTEEEATRITGITLDEFRTASFAGILKNRQG